MQEWKAWASYITSCEQPVGTVSEEHSRAQAGKTADCQAKADNGGTVNKEARKAAKKDRRKAEKQKRIRETAEAEAQVKAGAQPVKPNAANEHAAEGAKARREELEKIKEDPENIILE